MFVIFCPCRFEYKDYESFVNCPTMRIKSDIVSTMSLEIRLEIKQKEVKALTEEVKALAERLVRGGNHGGDHGGDHGGSGGDGSGGSGGGGGVDGVGGVGDVGASDGEGTYEHTL